MGAVVSAESVSVVGRRISTSRSPRSHGSIVYPLWVNDCTAKTRDDMNCVVTERASPHCKLCAMGLGLYSRTGVAVHSAGGI